MKTPERVTFGLFRLFPANSWMLATHLLREKGLIVTSGQGVSGFGAMEERQDRGWPSWGFYKGVYRSLIGGLLVCDICEITAR